MRAIMIPRRPNHVLVHADYSALEVTVLSKVANDPALIQVFLDGKDIHRYAASKIFGKPEAEITSEERRFSKSCTFGILYGKGVAAFAIENTGGDVPKAQAIFDAFFKQFPGIKEFIHKAHAEIDRTNAYVTTLLGNKVPIDVNAGGGAKYRQAQNQIIQSLGSMVAGTSMYQFLEYCEKQGWDCAPYAFTHDAYDDSTSVDTLFEYLEGMEEMLVNNVRKTIGIPVSIDYELAANGRDLCSIDFTPREQGERAVTIKGTDIAIKGLLSRLKLSQTYDLGDIEVETSEPVDFGWSELWGVGKALKYEWGKTIQQSKATFKVKYRKN